MSDDSSSSDAKARLTPEIAAKSRLRFELRSSVRGEPLRACASFAQRRHAGRRLQQVCRDWKQLWDFGMED